MESLHQQVKVPHLLSAIEKEKLALQFSEGSEEYRKLLLLLWDYGIETNAGCSGILENHAPEWHYCSFAYISMVPRPETERLINDFIDILKTNKFDERYVSEKCKFDDSSDEKVILRMASLRRIGTRDHTIRFSKDECEAFFKELRNNFEKCHNRRTFIIAAFAGVGKTTLAEKYSNVLDLESSPYMWDYSDLVKEYDRENIKGDRTRKPNSEWPQNYIKAIKDNCGKYDYILVLGGLTLIVPHYVENGITIDAYLLPSEDALEQYCERYKQRGNTDEFISWMREAWGRQMIGREKVSKNVVVLERGETLESYLTSNQKYPPLLPKK